MHADGTRPPPPEKKLQPSELVKGSWVEYYSRTHEAWIPCTITDVNGETGDVTIDIKPTPISAFHVECFLRKRTIPSSDQLDWLRRCLQNDEISSEGIKVFNRFAQPSTLVDHPCISQNSVHDIANECNLLFGVSGWLGVIKTGCFSSQHEATQDAWLECFRNEAQCIHDTYGNALVAKRAPCHFENPKERYDFDNKLGEGTFGVVFLAQAKDTRAHRAVKRLSKEILQLVHEEIENLCAMDHPHIVKLFEWFDYDQHIYLVMDFCTGGELTDEIRRRRHPHTPFQENFVCEVMQQLLSAMTYMHGRGLLHLDIKTDNILLTSIRSTLPPAMSALGQTLAPPQEHPHIMVIDLGVGFFVTPGDLCPLGRRPCGTPLFMAPEVWSCEFTPKADVFSMGVVLFMMLSLAFPFLMKAGDTGFFREYWSKKPEVQWDRVLGMYNDDAVQLCKDMMNQDRHDRPSASQCLQSAFIRRATSPGAQPSSHVYQDKLDQILKFPKRSLLYKSVALTIAKAWPANQCPSVKRFFDHMDIDGYGQLHVDRVATALVEFGVNAEAAVASAAAMALSRKESILWTEFLAACIDLGAVQLEQDLRRVFNQADVDHDGCLSEEDIGNIIAGQHLRGEALHAVFREVTGGNGRLTLVDWLTFRDHFRYVYPPRLPAPPAPGNQPSAAPVPADTDSSNYMSQFGDFWEQIVNRSLAPRCAQSAHRPSLPATPSLAPQVSEAEGSVARTGDRLAQDLQIMGYNAMQAAEAAKRFSSVEAAVDWLVTNGSVGELY